MNSNRASNLAPLMLSFGLAFVFLYAAVESFAHPLEWIGYLPSIMTKFVSASFAIHAIAVSELILGAWLLSGKYKKYAAAASALMLAGIVAANLNQFIITFRDVGLFFAALALFFIDE